MLLLFSLMCNLFMCQHLNKCVLGFQDPLNDWFSFIKKNFSKCLTLIIFPGISPRVSLIISPSRTQHFTYVSLSLSCEDQSNSDRWRVRRYTDNEQLEDCSSSHWGLQTGSTCTISSTIASDTGVYWCQSESGENYHPVNNTVHRECFWIYLFH